MAFSCPAALWHLEIAKGSLCTINYKGSSVPQQSCNRYPS